MCDNNAPAAVRLQGTSAGCSLERSNLPRCDARRRAFQPGHNRGLPTTVSERRRARCRESCAVRAAKSDRHVPLQTLQTPIVRGSALDDCRNGRCGAGLRVSNSRARGTPGIAGNGRATRVEGIRAPGRRAAALSTPRGASIGGFPCPAVAGAVQTGTGAAVVAPVRDGRTARADRRDELRRGRVPHARCGASGFAVHPGVLRAIFDHGERLADWLRGRTQQERTLWPRLFAAYRPNAAIAVR
jgi:hypothetical protein